MNYGKLEKTEKKSNLDFNISEVVIPFSKFFNNQKRQDIYVGNENLPFNKKHPIFKALMRIEFEDAMRKFHNIT